MIERINPPQLFDGSAFSMSQVVRTDATSLVFISGQVAWDAQATVKGQTHAEQTRLALGNVKVALEAAGSSVEQILKLRIYLRGECADVSEAVTPIFVDFLGETKPTMTVIGVASLATPDTLVEIEAIASINDR